MDKLERVARAIAESDGNGWDTCYPVQREEYLDNAQAAIAALEPVTVQEAARVLLDNLNKASDFDELIQASMQKEADTDGTEEWVFVLCAGLSALAERGE